MCLVNEGMGYEEEIGGWEETEVKELISTTPCLYSVLVTVISVPMVLVRQSSFQAAALQKNFHNTISFPSSFFSFPPLGLELR